MEKSNMFKANVKVEVFNVNTNSLVAINRIEEPELKNYVKDLDKKNLLSDTRILISSPSGRFTAIEWVDYKDFMYNFNKVSHLLGMSQI